jgi:hypothetical protein
MAEEAVMVLTDSIDPIRRDMFSQITARRGRRHCVQIGNVRRDHCFLIRFEVTVVMLYDGFTWNDFNNYLVGTFDEFSQTGTLQRAMIRLPVIVRSQTGSLSKPRNYA